MFTSYPDLVDITQLKEMLGIGITLAYRLVRNKTIKSLKVCRQYKIPKRNVNGKRKQKWVSTGLSEKGNNNSEDKLFITYLKEWLLSIKNTIEENTYDSYNVIVNKTCAFFEDKNILLNDLNL